jgi:hypothetical protein
MWMFSVAIMKYSSLLGYESQEFMGRLSQQFSSYPKFNGPEILVQSCYSPCLFRLVFIPGTLHPPSIPFLVACICLVSWSWYPVSAWCSRLSTLYRLVSQSRYLVFIWCPSPGTWYLPSVPFLVPCIRMVSHWYLILYLPSVPVLVPCIHQVSQCWYLVST